MSDTGLASLLYLVGFFMVLLGMMLLMINFLSRGGVRRGGVGGVILVGPFPIIFGSGSRIMRMLMVISILFVAIMLLAVFLPHLTRLVEGF